MLAKSLFVSEEVHERKVVLPNGEEHSLFFKQIAHVDFRKFLLAEKSGDDDKQAASMAKLIASSLCEPDGKPAITVAQALKLNAAAANAIAEKVLEVNGYGEKGNG
jgi:hypothetical protein